MKMDEAYMPTAISVQAVSCTQPDLFNPFLHSLSQVGCYYAFTYMLTLPDYPGVSRIWHKSPDLPCGRGLTKSPG